ncbi:MAG TPA: cytochrome c [Rhodocyclaceae bacterium]|nr:cytochrome c [Rhodocyclaceae bacterium]
MVRRLLLGAALALAGCAGDVPEAGIDPSDAGLVARGEAVYRQHCAACHGVDLEGQPEWRRRLPNGRLPAPPHDESGHTWHHTNAELFAMTRNGMVPPLAPPGYESDMPAYAEVLADHDIRAVLAYIQSTWPPEIMSVRRTMLEQRSR